MACDPDILPLESRIAEAADEGDLDDIYETERRLLYVACARARDRLCVTGVAPGSEFLKDFRPGPYSLCPSAEGGGVSEVADEP